MPTHPRRWAVRIMHGGTEITASRGIARCAAPPGGSSGLAPDVRRERPPRRRGRRRAAGGASGQARASTRKPRSPQSPASPSMAMPSSFGTLVGLSASIQAHWPARAGAAETAARLANATHRVIPNIGSTAHCVPPAVSAGSCAVPQPRRACRTRCGRHGPYRTPTGTARRDLPWSCEQAGRELYCR